MPWLDSGPGSRAWWHVHSFHLVAGSRLASMDFLDYLTGSQPTPADGNHGPPMLDMLSDILALRDGTDSRSTVDQSIEDGRLLPQQRPRQRRRRSPLANWGHWRNLGPEQRLWRGQVLRAGKAAKVAKGDQQTVVSAMWRAVEELALKRNVRGRLMKRSKFTKASPKQAAASWPDGDRRLYE